MTTYRLFPSTNGPASAVSYSGNFIAGVIFSIDGDNCWFDGYWWWVAASGQDTTPVKCALWTASTTGAGAGQSYVVPGSVVTSGTLTAGQWNYIPLPQPVQLSRGYSPNISTAGTSCYIAAIGYVASSGFPDTNNFWTAAIDNGPLHAYEFANGGGGAGSPPWTMPQGVFSTGGSDPSVTMPGSASGTDNFWVDVQIDTTAPAGYTGSYRLYPNKGDANNDVAGDAAVNYTVATEVHLTRPCTLNNVWYFSPNSAASLATRADVWDISSGLSVASITSPSWKDHGGAAYTPTTNGAWIKAAFAPGTTLPAGSYRVSVYNSAGTGGSWSTKEASTDYWGQSTGGAGRNGMTWGPLYAPAWPNASSGFDYNAAGGSNTPPFSGAAEAHCQPVFAEDGTVGFPQLYAVVNTNQTQNYWVDLEVTPVPASEPVVPPPWQFTPHATPGEPFTPWPPWAQAGQPAATIQGTASLAGAGSVTAAVTQGAGSSPAGAGSLSAAVTQQSGASPAAAGSLSALAAQQVVAALTGAGVVNASAGGNQQGTASIAGAGALSAAGMVIVPGVASLAGAGSLTAAVTLAATAQPAGAGAVAALAVQRAGATLAGAGAVAAAAASLAPFTVGRLTASAQSGVNAASTYAPTGTASTQSGMNTSTTSP